jgi:hypothetical protein
MKCKACNTTFIPKYFNQKFCVDNDECLKAFSDYAKITKEKTERKEWSERKSKLKKEMLTVQDYLKIAQQVFNAYIRKRDQGKNCISCQKPCKKENAGHYFNSNNHWNVRFNELNVHLQCEACNTYLSGNLIEYGINLEKLIGPDEFIILREEAYKTRKFTRDELKEIIEKYKKLK